MDQELDTLFSKLMLTLFHVWGNWGLYGLCVMFLQVIFCHFHLFWEMCKIKEMCPGGYGKGGPVLICEGCHNKVPHWVVWATEICCLTVVEPRDLQLRCWQGCFLLRVVGKNLPHVSLVAPGALLVIIGVLWLVDGQISVFTFTGWPLCVLR